MRNLSVVFVFSVYHTRMCFEKVVTAVNGDYLQVLFLSGRV